MKRRTPEQKRKIIAHAEEFGATEAAKRFRVPTSTVLRWMEAPKARMSSASTDDGAKVLAMPAPRSAPAMKPMTEKEELIYLREKVVVLREQRDQTRKAFENARLHAENVEQQAMQHHMAAIRAVAERDTYKAMLSDFITAKSAAEVVFGQTMATQDAGRDTNVRQMSPRAAANEKPSK